MASRSKGQFVPIAISGSDATGAAVDELLRQGTTCTHSATAGTCRDILKRELALWTFVDVEGVEPTNDFAEQKIRPGVLWRNSSFGTQSEAGSRYVERIMTVVSTLKQQKRNLLDYLTQACQAANDGQLAPTLLPTISNKRDSNIAPVNDYY